MEIIVNIDKALNQAAISTANKMIRKGNTAASKNVREVYNIKAATLNKYTKMFRASRVRFDGCFLNERREDKQEPGFWPVIIPEKWLTNLIELEKLNHFF